MKRYATTISIYVYAESDKEAIQLSKDIASEMRDLEDNDATVEEIHEMPFASLEPRKLNFKN